MVAVAEVGVLMPSETTTSLSSILKEHYDDSRDRQTLSRSVIKRMLRKGKGREQRVEPKKQR